MYRSRI